MRGSCKKCDDTAEKPLNLIKYHRDNSLFLTAAVRAQKRTRNDDRRVDDKMDSNKTP